jgi:2-methylcitrate dehydratase PrpD
MSKPLHAGHAAASGVLAAGLARRGMSGARRILEGGRGFFAATSQDADPQRVVGDLAPQMADYRITGVSIKPYASCRHTHSAIDAGLQIRSQFAPDPEQIARVEVETYEAALTLNDNPAPTRPDAAQFSFQYCVASALWRGSVDLPDFGPDTIMDPGLRSLMSRVTVRHSPALEQRYPAAWPVRVSVALRDGQTLVQSVETPKGDPENPLSWDELKSKFCRMVIGTEWEPRAEALIEGVCDLDRRKTVDLLEEHPARGPDAP